MRGRSGSTSTPSCGFLSATRSNASITVLPVTVMAESGMPSASRLRRDCSVGAKCQCENRPATVRFASSGKGLRRLPVRNPAST